MQHSPGSVGSRVFTLNPLQSLQGQSMEPTVGYATAPNPTPKTLGLNPPGFWFCKMLGLFIRDAFPDQSRPASEYGG